MSTPQTTTDRGSAVQRSVVNLREDLDPAVAEISDLVAQSREHARRAHMADPTVGGTR